MTVWRYVKCTVITVQNGSDGVIAQPWLACHKKTKLLAASVAAKVATRTITATNWMLQSDASEILMLEK
jgi:hypothetical protein